MNIETLRKTYKELTPFERASLYIHEAVGRQRESEVEALRALTTIDRIKTTLWRDAFYILASFAMYKAQLAITAYLLLSLTLQEEHELTESIKLYDTALGWIKALQRLEKETGAPFIEATKLLDPTFAEQILHKEDCNDTDDIQQYKILEQIWRTLS